MNLRNVIRASAACGVAMALTSCALVPSSGPTRAQVEDAPASSAQSGIQIVDVTDEMARELRKQHKEGDFVAAFGDAKVPAQFVGPGDVLEVFIWEAPPAALFGVGALQGDTSTSGSRAAVLPPQMIDANGDLEVPFAGRIRAAGRSIPELSREIRQKLVGKANQPQVMIRVAKNATSFVTVVGDVGNSIRMELTAGGERLLDSLASAGGVKQRVDRTTIQLSRGKAVEAVPLQKIIRDPRQNVVLQPRDVVTVLYQPYSFTVLGASGTNEEINFEAQGISLSQALARGGGLNDSRSDSRGVFVFRFESPDALKWPHQPVATTPDGKVPVIYRINLKDPGSFFVAQHFMVTDKDLVYVSNAPVAELQKFMNLVFSGLYPTLSVINATK